MIVIIFLIKRFVAIKTNTVQIRTKFRSKMLVENENKAIEMCENTVILDEMVI